MVPMYEDLRHSAKLHLLQSAVSRLLVDLVFDAYFVGLPPEQAAQLEEVESFLEPFGKSSNLFASGCWFLPYPSPTCYPLHTEAALLPVFFFLSFSFVFFFLLLLSPTFF